jgi:hypothetical protein
MMAPRLRGQFLTIQPRASAPRRDTRGASGSLRVLKTSPFAEQNHEFKVATIQQSFCLGSTVVFGLFSG